jgi:hypothetical protein
MAVTPNSIITPQTPVCFTAVAVAADVAWHAPVNMVTLVNDATENTNGMRLTKVYAIQRAALAGNLNCVLYKKVGSTYTLLDSVLMTNTTPSATVANIKAVFQYSEDDPLYLPANVGLAVAIGTTVTNGVAFAASGGAY